ncbi:phosphotransferase [Psychrosphaera aestuarii]|uniref:phosphotransferase n=1 Tax=Psychrosphaera aestuarii TaxID=1266052 RepID=UPI001B337DE8|nr:phosphotransferase [Psychrosphaera aestuarii]
MDKLAIKQKLTELFDSPVSSFQLEKNARNLVYKAQLENNRVWYLKRIAETNYVHELSVSCLNLSKPSPIAVPQALVIEHGNIRYAVLSDVPAISPIIYSTDRTNLITCLRHVHSFGRWPELQDLQLPNPVLLLEKYLPNSGMPVKSKLFDCYNTLSISKYRGVLHGDLSLGNIYHSKSEKVGIIDWEYASFGDVRWDLAAFAIENQLTRHEFHQILADYAKQAGFSYVDFSSDADIWLVYYWLVTVDWAEKNNFKSQEYRDLHNNITSIIQQF